MINFRELRQSAFFSASVITVLILTAILGALFYYLTFNQVSSANTSNAITSRLTAQSVMEKVDRNFYERFGDVQAYAFNKLAVATADSSAPVPGMQTFINTMTAYYVLYDLMLVCNRDGKVVAVNTKDKNGKDIPTHTFLNKNMSGEEWFRACTSGDGPKGGAWFSDFVADPQIGKVYGTSGRGMGFAAPIRNEENAVVGVWYNFASWMEVTEGIRKEAEANLLKDHPGAFIVMTKQSGEIISAENATLFGQATAVDHEERIASKNEDLIPVRDLMQGVARSKGAYTFAGKGWVTAAFIPKAKISWSIFFSKETFIAVVVCLLVFALTFFYIYIFFRKNIISKIDRIRDLQQRLGEGQIVELEQTTGSNNEFDQMTNSLAKLAKSLKFKAAFADEISSGNLEATLSDVNANDALGNSLLNMRHQLQLAKESEGQRSWTAEGLAQIGVILRSYDNTDNLYANIIKFIVTYLKANQGGIFLVNEVEEEKRISLASCYAYDKKRFKEKEFNWGEGLIGQCIVEKQTTYLTDIPRNFISITSGLGGASPKSLLIVPLKTNEDVHGAIEVASFHPLKPFEIDFVEKLAESISASLTTIRVTENTSTLLTKLQQQTEEMRAQEEEMRQNMEELSATQEEMIRKEKEYIVRIQTLEKA